MKGKLMIAALVAAWYIIGVKISYMKENSDTVRSYTTEYGDEFVFHTDSFQKKTQLISSDRTFNCRVHYYDESDNIITLYDSPEIRVYQVSDLVFCKVKAKDTYILTDVYRSEEAEIYDYLRAACADDERAMRYLGKALMESSTQT